MGSSLSIFGSTWPRLGIALHPSLILAHPVGVHARCCSTCPTERLKQQRSSFLAAVHTSNSSCHPQLSVLSRARIGMKIPDVPVVRVLCHPEHRKAQSSQSEPVEARVIQRNSLSEKSKSRRLWCAGST